MKKQTVLAMALVLGLTGSGGLSVRAAGSCCGAEGKPAGNEKTGQICDQVADGAPVVEWIGRLQRETGLPLSGQYYSGLTETLDRVISEAVKENGCGRMIVIKPGSWGFGCGTGEGKEPECAGGDCGNDEVKEPECTGGDCGNSEIKEPECAGGDCGTGEGKETECTGGDCGTSEVKEPECTGGDCGNSEVKEPECTGGDCGTGEGKEPECTGGDCGNSEVKEPECPDGNCGQDAENQAPEDADAGLTVDLTQVSYAEQILQLVNVERAKAGLSALTLDEKLCGAAQVRAGESRTSFSHTRPDGRSFSSVLADQGIAYRRAGENIAWGQRSAQEVMDGWMNSEGHRANILNAEFTKLGVGHAADAAGRQYWSQLFTD